MHWILTALTQLEHEINTALRGALSSKKVEELRVIYLGKKGQLTELVNALREVTAEEKPIIGKALNEAKSKITSAFEEALNHFQTQELQERLATESIDITLPGRSFPTGQRHVLLQTMDRCLDVLKYFGFAVAYGPEIDNDYYNFEALHIPKDHPARDMQDTFYITSDLLLRTHTSNTQVRVMMTSSPPIRIASPGKVYRNEEVSSRSHIVFHQVEGLYIDEQVSFSDLLKTLQSLFAMIFHQDVQLRFRPSFFPFVEPGVEVDMKCLLCTEGCSVCKHSGWLEVAGAGMVHPEVLKNGGLDPEIHRGYAFAFGIERLAMLLHGISDIRLFLENDQRFLDQFA